MKDIEGAIWLDARKAKSLILSNCLFEGNGKGIAILSSNGNVKIANSQFINQETAIVFVVEKEQILELTKNTFRNNLKAIDLRRQNRTTGTTTINFTLKCNTFIHEPINGVYPSRKGLVIGQGVRVYTRDGRAPYPGPYALPDQIGGGFSKRNFGDPDYRPYPNANVWPTEQIDRSYSPPVDPFTGLQYDIQNITQGWQDIPNWTAIENNSNRTITYYRYQNEFVKNEISELNGVDFNIPTTKVATQGNTFLDPGSTYEFACDNVQDPLPILFPARIAVNSNMPEKINLGKENYLGNAMPNPIQHNSTIGFELIDTVENVVFQILELGTGRVLQSMEIKEREKGERRNKSGYGKCSSRDLCLSNYY